MAGNIDMAELLEPVPKLVNFTHFAWHLVDRRVSGGVQGAMRK